MGGFTVKKPCGIGGGEEWLPYLLEHAMEPMVEFEPRCRDVVFEPVEIVYEK